AGQTLAHLGAAYRRAPPPQAPTSRPEAVGAAVRAAGDGSPRPGLGRLRPGAGAAPAGRGRCRPPLPRDAAPACAASTPVQADRRVRRGTPRAEVRRAP